MNYSNKPSEKPDPALIAAMQACVAPARAWLNSTEAVSKTGHLSIAYHLATLALEKLGNRELRGEQWVASKATGPSWPTMAMQDRVKKLLWCFFGAGSPLFASRRERPAHDGHICLGGAR